MPSGKGPTFGAPPGRSVEIQRGSVEDSTAASVRWPSVHHWIRTPRCVRWDAAATTLQKGASHAGTEMSYRLRHPAGASNEARAAQPFAARGDRCVRRARRRLHAGRRLGPDADGDGVRSHRHAAARAAADRPGREPADRAHRLQPGGHADPRRLRDADGADAGGVPVRPVAADAERLSDGDARLGPGERAAGSGHAHARAERGRGGREGKRPGDRPGRRLRRRRRRRSRSRRRAAGRWANSTGWACAATRTACATPAAARWSGRRRWRS